ncbi:MAG: alpha/beta fold hydrolase [Lentisphaeria bacterium]|nr:alpha/beta fold hydrolase [Lentisphaeria bacterium]
MRKIILTLAVGLLTGLLLCSCATTHDYPDDDPRSAQVWTPSAVVEEMAGSDPIEPFNRSMFAVNDVLMHYLVRPVSWIYGSILPKEAIKRIDYVSDNLAFPGRMISCFCQLKFLGGGIEFVRFITNFTVGIVGLFDPAEYYLGLPKGNDNMGKAFAYWGIGPGFILVLPLSPHITFRDHVGMLFDKTLDFKLIIPYAGWVSLFNSAVNSYDGYNLATETAYDKYDMARMGLVALRYISVRDYHKKTLPGGPLLPFFRPTWYLRPDGRLDIRLMIDEALVHFERENAARAVAEIPPERLVRIAPEYHPQSAEVDTMKFALFNMQKNNVSWWVKSSIWNTDFVGKASHRSVRLHPERPKLSYHLWEAEDPNAPLALLLPGVGGHHRAAQLRALAENIYERGYSVLVVSSVYNPVFMEATGNFLPGNTPQDAEILRDALKKILADVRENTELRPASITLAGYSMGGLHTLYLADLERKKPELNIRNYLAIDPPADLAYALRKFDEYFERSREWTRAEFFRQGSDALVKYAHTVSQDYPRLEKYVHCDPRYSLAFSRRQAAVLAGFSFRLTLREILLTAKRRNPEWPVIQNPFSWGSRDALYREIDTFSGMKYAEKCLLPEYRRKHPGAGLDELNAHAGLRQIETTLRQAQNIRVIHTVDDPLISAADRKFLNDALGSRIVWFDCGGHLGNLFSVRHEEEVFRSFPAQPKPQKDKGAKSEKDKAPKPEKKSAPVEKSKS